VDHWTVTTCVLGMERLTRNLKMRSPALPSCDETLLMLRSGRDGMGVTVCVKVRVAVRVGGAVDV